MARTGKTTRNKVTAKQPETKPVAQETKAKKTVKKVVVQRIIKKVSPLDPVVEKAMQLNPHLQYMWITENGFVHAPNVPECMRKGAKFYKNKYYNK